MLYSKVLSKWIFNIKVKKIFLQFGLISSPIDTELLLPSLLAESNIAFLDLILEFHMKNQGGKSKFGCFYLIGEFWGSKKSYYLIWTIVEPKTYLPGLLFKILIFIKKKVGSINTNHNFHLSTGINFSYPENHH